MVKYVVRTVWSISLFQPGKASPYCTGDPVFTLAEPSDLKIVCGEFDSGVEIVRNSLELEQVFNIKRIVNHPSYQPNRVGKPNLGS